MINLDGLNNKLVYGYLLKAIKDSKKYILTVLIH